MKLKTMDVDYNAACYSISFHVNLSYAGIIDLLAFIKGVELRFVGNIESAHPFWREPGKAFGAITIAFDEIASYDDAKRYCKEKLTATGRVSASYVGALDHIDPHRMQARKLLETIQQEPYSNNY